MIVGPAGLQDVDLDQVGATIDVASGLASWFDDSGDPLSDGDTSLPVAGVDPRALARIALAGRLQSVLTDPGRIMRCAEADRDEVLVLLTVLNQVDLLVAYSALLRSLPTDLPRSGIASAFWMVLASTASMARRIPWQDSESSGQLFRRIGLVDDAAGRAATQTDLVLGAFDEVGSHARPRAAAREDAAVLRGMVASLSETVGESEPPPFRGDLTLDVAPIEPGASDPFPSRADEAVIPLDVEDREGEGAYRWSVSALGSAGPEGTPRLVDVELVGDGVRSFTFEYELGPGSEPGSDWWLLGLGTGRGVIAASPLRTEDERQWIGRLPSERDYGELRLERGLFDDFMPQVYGDPTPAEEAALLAVVASAPSLGADDGDGGVADPQEKATVLRYGSLASYRYLAVGNMRLARRCFDHTIVHADATGLIPAREAYTWEEQTIAKPTNDARLLVAPLLHHGSVAEALDV